MTNRPNRIDRIRETSEVTDKIDVIDQWMDSDPSEAELSYAIIRLTNRLHFKEKLRRASDELSQRSQQAHNESVAKQHSLAQIGMWMDHYDREWRRYGGIYG